jgi:hypothetical protein
MQPITQNQWQAGSKGAERSSAVEQNVVPRKAPSSAPVRKERRDNCLLKCEGRASICSHSVDHSNERKKQQERERWQDGECPATKGRKQRKCH